MPTATPLVEVEGSTAATALAESLGVSLSGAGSAQTVGGLLLQALGRIPRVGERFSYQGLEFAFLSWGVRRVRARTGDALPVAVLAPLVMVAIVTPLELAPPLIFRNAIDRYFVPALKHAIPEGSAWSGIAWLSLLLLAVLTFDFLAQYVQIRIMQRVGQQTMYDMRGEIFRHMQRLPMSYFDRNPVGRLVTRVTTDVDALNDLFAAGVVTMINDFFLLVVMAGLLFKIDGRLALDTLAVLPGILIVSTLFSKNTFPE